MQFVNLLFLLTVLVIGTLRCVAHSNCPALDKCPYLAQMDVKELQEKIMPCPIMKNCPHFNKDAQDKECPYFKDGKWIGEKVDGCPMEKKCPYYDKLKENPDLIKSAKDCPFFQSCPFLGDNKAKTGCPFKNIAKDKKCPHCGETRNPEGCELGDKCPLLSDKKTGCPFMNIGKDSKCPHCGDTRNPEGCKLGDGCPLLGDSKAKAGYPFSAWFSTLFPEESTQASLAATAYISLVPISMLSLMPVNVSVEILNLLVSFAAGGLLGDVFLHLLPHSFSPHSHDEHGHSHGHSHSHGHGHSHDHGHGHGDEFRNLQIGLGVLAGFVLFFIIEKAMRIFGTHNHSHETKETDKTEKTDKIEKTGNAVTSLRLAAYLNLLADSMHNFTDGLAIAAAFHASRTLGITTTLACFFHEIPHEVGDFAILIRSGFTRRQAILVQLVTACGAIAGTIVGNIIGGADGWVSELVLPITAGGFIYIATVGIIPELLESSKTKSKGQQITLLFGQAFMMVVGVALMAWIALNE